MKKRSIHLPLLIVIVLLGSCTPKQLPSTETLLAFPEIDQTSKPWTRWWWHGSSVTKAGITAELEALQKAGIGGVELTPIYGVQGEEAAFIDYLTADWTAMLIFTLQEAERLGLGVDMATGTGWPFGGPWVDADIACKNMEVRNYSVIGGERLREKVTFEQAPILRTVRPINEKLADIIDPIVDNPNLQQLALDQVRFQKMLPLQTLMAYSDQGEVLDLTAKVDESGTLDWVAPKGNWELYALFQGWHGKMVERAAPGGEGNVLDHFSKEAIEGYLAKFDQAFNQQDLQSLRAFFNDSYEVDDARGQANWTPDLLAAFEERRGYDLRQHLPELFSEQGDENHRRVLSDYRETISDLLLENFTNTWFAWAQKKGAIIRNQAHGSPANILDLYAASDIPETEGKDLIKAKMASSAAHVTGKKLASAEAATWLGEHFSTNLADLKENVDRYLVAGINHVFYHGTCYSPPGEEWPGRLFYAAIHANPRNSLWEDYPAFNAYLARTQAFLQAGSPDNDVLLYFPAYDRFARDGEEMLEHFDGWATPRRSEDTTQVRKTAMWLQDQGYAFDFISDRQLLSLTYQDEALQSAANKYQTILVPETAFMPLATLEKLLSLQEAGARIIFQQLPKSVPGWNDLKDRQAQFDELLSKLEGNGAKAQPNLALGLSELGVFPEEMTKWGLEYYRQLDQGTKIYFISNWSGKNVDDWLPINTDARSIAIFNPMSGNTGLAETRKNNDKIEVKLQLNNGESLLLKTFDSNVSGVSWPYRQKDKPGVALTGPWELTFVKGGPELPEKQTLDQLKHWTDLQGAAFQSFSGTAIYATRFAKPESVGKGILLDLGTVSESASVTINAKKVGTTIGPVYQVFIPSDLLAEENKLEIAVSNLMANRVSSLEKAGKRWQKFYNINVSANKAENLGEDRVFTTKQWSTRPSGLAGPVTITEVN